MLFSVSAFSQLNSSELGSWTMLFNQTRLHDRLSLHSEVQLRSYEIKPNTEQLLMRVGVNFHMNSSVLGTAGYGWITNYADDRELLKDQYVEEHRAWQQIVLKHSFARVFFEHRYRYEQRWISTSLNDSYKNRLRYLLRLTIPLNEKEIKKKTLFLTFYNEIFVHMNKELFDRNRLYGALGFQVSSTTNIQLGYLLQTVGTRSRQFLQLGLTFNPDLRKKN